MTITTYGIMFALFLVGWLIGFFDSNLRTAKKIKAAEQKSEIAIKDAEDKIAKAEAQIALASETPKDDPGLLRLKQDNGRFVLEIDGAPVTDPIPSDKRKRLIDLITILRPWLEGKPTPQPSTPPTAPSPTPPAVAPAQPAISRPATIPAKPVEIERPLSATSIVGQIDSILQAKLTTTSYAKAGIRLQESLQGGVEVYVGLQKFETVDDVSDPEIKSLIRAAIAEWEHKYTPGM